jgi:protein O-GlcNAc transferase
MTEFTTQQTLELAIREHQAGRLQEARRLYQRVLDREPAHPDALRFLGVLAYQAGQNDAALELIRRVIAMRPDYVSAYSDLGNILRAKGEFDEAIAAFSEAIALNPAHAIAYSNMGNALMDKGRTEEAIAAFGKALAIDPHFADAHFNLGYALITKGDLEEAARHYEQAIVYRPTHAEAHRHLGKALYAMGRLDEAIAGFRRAIVLQPGEALAYTDLGNAQQSKGQLDEAVENYNKAIALNPKDGVPYGSLGCCLSSLGRAEESIAAHREALALNPADRIAHSNLIFAMQFHPEYDTGAIAEELRRWNSQHAAPLKKYVRPHANDRDPARRLRVGFVSGDLREHVVGRHVQRLFAELNRDEFELFAYANGVEEDELSRKLKLSCVGWRNIARVGDAEAAALIREDKIDVLIDLALHSAGNRLLVFARKPAPVQASWLGYPGSTGIEAMDYRLTDPYLDPPGIYDACYSERSVRLADTFWCYKAFENGPEGGPPPCLANKFVTFGCLNDFRKVNEPLLDRWAEILSLVDGSRLMMVCPEGTARQFVTERFGRRAIGSDRIQWVSRQSRMDYLRTYQQIDIALDTSPYCGGITTCDALWMGVPVVTLAGRTVVGRGGVSILSNVKLPELIARTPAEYVRIAVGPAGEVSRLQGLRRELRGRMEESPLMDGVGFARQMEVAYRTIWKAWCGGH